MAIALRQRRNGSVPSLAYSSAVLAHSLLVCVVHDTNNVSAVSDGVNTWQSAVEGEQSSGQDTTYTNIFYAMNSAAGTPTVSPTGSTGLAAIIIYEFTGAATSAALDQVTHTNDVLVTTSTTSFSPGTFTCAAGDCIVSACSAAKGTGSKPVFTAGSGFIDKDLSSNFGNGSNCDAVSEYGYPFSGSQTSSVNLTQAAGTSYAGGCAAAFKVAPAPTVTSCTPSSGTTAGGTSITNLAGTGFVATPTVTFGGNAAISVSFSSSTQLTCVTPAHAAGAVNIVVTNPDTQTGTLSNGFTYTTPLNRGSFMWTGR